MSPSEPPALPADLGPLRRGVRRLAALPIVAYRRWLSPLKPPMCRFAPTCSAYAHEALLRHGLWRGTYLAIWRVLRCQPFARGGYDPVPGSEPRGGHDTCPEHGSDR